MKNALRRIIQEAESTALLEEAEKEVYRKLLKLDTTKELVDGLLDFGWDHEMILNDLIEDDK